MSSRSDRALEEVANVRFDVLADDYCSGKVKHYEFVIDHRNKLVYHDCMDYAYRGTKLHIPCKHLIAVLVLTGKKVDGYEFTTQYPGPYIVKLQTRDPVTLPDISSQEQEAARIEDVRKGRIMDMLIRENAMISMHRLRRHFHLGNKSMNTILKIMQNERLVIIIKRSVTLA